LLLLGIIKNTTESVYRQIGVFDKDKDITGKGYMGREFDAISKLEKINAFQNATVFTRIGLFLTIFR
jgi:Ca2+ transporting ATPase